MVRATIIDKDGVKRGAWSSEEDDKLRAYVQKYGPWKWRELPRLAGLTRCGKSCRLRWLNYLRPGLKRGNYTNEEDGLICKLHKKYGNKWSTIAAKLPGRTDNEIKNHWNAHLKKQMREKSEATTQPKQKQLSPNVEAGTDNFTDFSSTTFGILESSSLSQQTPSTSTSTSSDGDGDLLGVNWEVEDYDPIIYQDFWNEPFILDRDNVGHVLDGSLQFSADCVMFSPQHETTYEDYMDLFCFLP